MLSQVELEYVKALINTYRNKGYKYYMCHTISDNNNNDYDICIYFSKEKIEALNDNYFSVEKGIRIYIDSSSKSNYNTNASDTVSSFSNNVTVDLAEFIYTNAESEYSYSAICLNPDLLVDYKQNHLSVITLILMCIIFCYIFIKDLIVRG